MSQFTRRNHGAGHSYALNGQKIPGVTTVLNALNKPGLINWAANTAGRYAVDHWSELADMSPSARLDAISGAHRSSNRAARVRGTRIHTFGWHLVQGHSLEVPEELAAPVAAYARFLDAWEMEPIYSEMPVCNTTHAYGGTLDAVVSCPRLGTVLLDIKTGGVFRETALQLAAYRYAEIGTAEDEEIVLNPDHVDLAAVARVYSDDVELVPVDAGRETWDAFLHLLTVYRWTVATEDESPIGNALFPEEVAV